MNKRYYFVLATTCLSLTACSQVDSMRVFDHQQAAALLQQMHTMKPAQQMIALPLPDKQHWHKIDLSYQTIGSPLMLVPQGQSLQNWHESIRTQIRGYENYHNITAEKFVQQQITHAKTHCKQADTAILNKTSDAIIYRLNLSGCADSPDQQQIGKAFQGSDAVYAVYYSALSRDIDKTRWGRMSNTIQHARLVDSASRYRTKTS